MSCIVILHLHATLIDFTCIYIYIYINIFFFSFLIWQNTALLVSKQKLLKRFLYFYFRCTDSGSDFTDSSASGKELQKTRSLCCNLSDLTNKYSLTPFLFSGARDQDGITLSSPNKHVAPAGKLKMFFFFFFFCLSCPLKPFFGRVVVSAVVKVHVVICKSI